MFICIVFYFIFVSSSILCEAQENPIEFQTKEGDSLLNHTGIAGGAYFKGFSSLGKQFRPLADRKNEININRANQNESALGMYNKKPTLVKRAPLTLEQIEEGLHTLHPIALKALKAKIENLLDRNFVERFRIDLSGNTVDLSSDRAPKSEEFYHLCQILREKMPQLMNLNLSRNLITIPDLSPLALLENLKSLNLEGNTLTQWDLEHIKQHKSLEIIYLTDKNAIEWLEDWAPHLQINPPRP